ncbi:MAG: S24/S26 family peptidase [Acidobacteriota bacterium]
MKLDLVGEALLQRGMVRFEVTSSSMEPGIRVGDRVEVRARPPGIGEVALYRDPVLGHVVHRVLWRWPLVGTLRWAYTKGDAIPHRDRRIGGDQLLGTVVRVLRTGARPRARRWGAWMVSIAGLMRHRLGMAQGAAPVGATDGMDGTEPGPAPPTGSGGSG